MNGNPWALYDALIGAIPEDVLVTDACMGSHWSYVEAESGMGVASTCRGGVRQRLRRRNLVGHPLREVAGLVRSWDFETASMGVAALNAWYNQPSAPGVTRGRVSMASGEDDRDVGDPFFALPQELAAFAGEQGRRARVVCAGRFPRMGGIAAEADLVVLERERRSDDDYPDTACEYLLPEADFALVTGMAAANKTLPRLLQLARSARTLVVGPSATIADAVLDAGASAVAGSVVTDPERVRDRLLVGGSPVKGAALVPCLLEK